MSEESHKQAVRKRRVRKDWREGTLTTPTVSHPPLHREEVEGPSSLLLPPFQSGTACVSSQKKKKKTPPGSLQSHWLLPPTSPPSLSYTHHRFASLPSYPQPLPVWFTCEMNPSGDFMHLADFFPSFFPSLIHCCQNTLRKKKPHLFHLISAVNLLSEYTPP